MNRDEHEVVHRHGTVRYILNDNQYELPQYCYKPGTIIRIPDREFGVCDDKSLDPKCKRRRYEIELFIGQALDPTQARL